MKSYSIVGIGILAILVHGCGGGGGTARDLSAPNFTSDSSVFVPENQKNIMHVHADDTSAVSYTISGGADQNHFKIDRVTGLLSFVGTVDFEHPSDSDNNNRYSVEITAGDTDGNSAKQAITVTVTDVDEIPPRFTSSSTITLTENRAAVITLHADDDSEVRYAVSSGEDASQFAILNPAAGKLRFKSSEDYEQPADSDGDNIYQVTVSATDSQGNKALQQLSVTVTNIDEVDTDDTDSDYIPNNIETLIGSEAGNDDSNNNGTPDGLDTEGSYGDTFFDMQWHILDETPRTTNYSGVETTGDHDLGVKDLYHRYMGYNKGKPIVVQVVDTGVDADHEDLSANMDLFLSYDSSNIGDPSANTTNTGYTHGTRVAGIIAARAFNGKGVRGIAPFAKIAGSNWLETQRRSDLETIWLTDGIAIVNNSWGRDFDTDTFYEDVMKVGSDTLRDGKGKIYVFAAGNSREEHRNANFQYSLSNRYAIAVAALKNTNTYADYSTPGANLLVSGYSGNYYSDSPTIGTTTIMGTSSRDTTWQGDTAHNYTFAMNGTSSASPTVAASIALVLEACPDLTWRDVRHLIATNAIKIDNTNPTWIENDAGLWYSTDYGFGLINAKGMIDSCTDTNYKPLRNENSTTVTETFNTPIGDNDSRTFTLKSTGDFTIEWIEVVIDNDNPSADDYEISLESPKGTKIVLLPEDARYGGQWMNGGFRFSTPAMMDELCKDQDEWKITLSDKQGENTGTVKSIKLTIYGQENI
jgi:kexin